MNTVPNLNQSTITGVTGLENRPVYFVSLNNSAEPTLVIKGEKRNDDAALSIKWASKMMKNVNDNKVNVKALDQTEINIFTTYSKTKFPPTSRQYMNLNNPEYIWGKNATDKRID